MNYKVFFLFFLLLSINVFAQDCNQKYIDSLKLALTHINSDDIERADNYLLLSNCYLKKNIDSAKIFIEKGRFISTSINYNKGLAISAIRMSEVKEIEGNILQAKENVSIAINLYENLDKDVDYLIALNLQGFFFERLSDFDNSLNSYFVGLKSAQKQSNKKFQAFFLNNISNVYDETGYLEESLKYCLEASQLFQSLNLNKYYGYTLVNIGILYINLEQFDLAKSYLLNANKIHLDLNDYYGLTKINLNLGSISIHYEDYNQALNYYLKSLEYSHSLDLLDPYRELTIADINKNLGIVYQSLNDNNNSIISFQKAISVGKKLKAKELLKGSYFGLYSIYDDLKQLDSSNYYIKLYLPINDSLNIEKYNQKIDELNFKNKLEVEKTEFEKEKELIVSRNKNQKIFFISIVSILSLIVLALVFFWYILKTKYQKSDLRRRNLKLEKEKLIINLERKNKELTASLLNLIERNKFISKISKTLESIKSKEKEVDLEKIERMISDIDKDLTKNLWKEFEMTYVKVHKNFFDKLSNISSALTSNERRLCALIKLNMSTKDISAITYQSEQSIKIARYRLRKKLGLFKNENLTSFLHNI